MRDNWYVITGGPSTGKTTLLNLLSKKGYMTVPEAARLLIDREMAKGKTLEQIRADEAAFQEEIARMKQVIEAELSTNTQTVFLDRGMQDTLAYLRHYDFEVKDWVHDALKAATYNKVFLLDPLPLYEKDYARSEDEAFVQQIDDLLYEAYVLFGMEPVRVPALSPSERINFILKHIDQDEA